MDKDTEQFFTAVKGNFNRLEEKVDKGFSTVDGRLNRLEDSVEQVARTTATILEIVQTNDQERKEMKASIKELDRRLTRMERSHA